MQTGNSSVCYQLSQTVDCNGFNFSVIGNSNNTFQGTLDGQGNSINNLMIISNVTGGVGLFGYANGATVMNLVMNNVNIFGNNGGVGSLFAQCSGCTITNVHLTTTSPFILNTIAGESYVGGIIGYYKSGTISNCTVENTFVNGSSANIGGFIGSGISVNMTNCYNLGVTSNASQWIIYGGSFYIGGLIGYCECCTLFQSGVQEGTIISNGCTGALFGRLDNPFVLSQVYARENVAVVCNGRQCGGIGGNLCMTSPYCQYSVNNIYSRANMTCTGVCCGGLLGAVNLGTFVKLNMSNSYSSSFINGTSSKGSIIGDICYRCPSSSLSFYQVYFNSQTNPSLPSIGNGNSTDGSYPQGFNCSLLYNAINHTFDESLIWGGDRLKSEFNFTHGYCNCSSLSISATTYLSTISQPATPLSTTLLSTTMQLTTNLPTSSVLPSTRSVSTLQQTTSIIQTTQQVSSSFPTTLPPSSCVYQVPHCLLCDPSPPVVNIEQIAVTCALIQNEWTWIFWNKTGNTITNNATILLNGTTALVEGNFTQTSCGQLVIVVNANNNNNNNKCSSLNVTGCVSISGAIQINLEAQPQQGNSTLHIISYNCSLIENVSSSQIQVTRNYRGGECDTISSQAVNMPNSLAVSLTSILGNKCGGVSLPLIIGLSVGIPCLLILIVAITITILKWRQNKKIVDVKRQIEKRRKDREMNSFQQNLKFQNKNTTKWTENTTSNEMEDRI